MDRLPRLGKRELICLLLFTSNYVVSVWMLGMGYVILLWHSLSLPYNVSFFTHICSKLLEQGPVNRKYVNSLKILKAKSNLTLFSTEYIILVLILSKLNVAVSSHRLGAYSTRNPDVAICLSIVDSYEMRGQYFLSVRLIFWR